MSSDVQNAISSWENKLVKAKRIARKRDSLIKKREEEITSCNKEIANLLGVKASNLLAFPKKRGPRPGTKKIPQPPLSIFVREVMEKGKEMQVKEVAEEVKNAGYRTMQKNLTNFRATVGVALKKDGEVKKIRRGYFVIKSFPVKDKEEK